MIKNSFYFVCGFGTVKLQVPQLKIYEFERILKAYRVFTVYITPLNEIIQVLNVTWEST